MNQGQIQKVALDSCVVIDVIEKPGTARKFKCSLRGKSVSLVILDTVLGEVKRVRGFTPRKIIGTVSARLGRQVEVVESDCSDLQHAREITSQFQICHNGDNKILASCKAREMVLVTFDKMLRRTGEFLGVPVFHPYTVGGI